MAVEGFLGRWSRRKREAEREAGRVDVDESVSEAGQEPADRNAEVPPAPTTSGAAVGVAATGADHVAVPAAVPGQAGDDARGRSAEAPGRGVEAEAQAPLIGAGGQVRAASIADALPDIATLTGDSDFSPFMRAGVDPQLRVAALKKLFADPRFNRMDGLDVYIDDYGKPDPLPAGMLRRLEQGRSMGLFRDEEEAEQVAAAGADEAGTAPPDPDAKVAGPDSASSADARAASDEVADGAAVTGNAARSGNVEGNSSIKGESLDRANVEGNDIEDGNTEGGNIERIAGIEEGAGSGDMTGGIPSGEPDRRGAA